jgi:hypothetical protein
LRLRRVHSPALDKKGTGDGAEISVSSFHVLKKESCLLALNGKLAPKRYDDQESCCRVLIITWIFPQLVNCPSSEIAGWCGFSIHCAEVKQKSDRISLERIEGIINKGLH